MAAHADDVLAADATLLPNGFRSKAREPFQRVKAAMSCSEDVQTGRQFLPALGIFRYGFPTSVESFFQYDIAQTSMKPSEALGSQQNVLSAGSDGISIYIL